jgi:hypothetical protein
MKKAHDPTRCVTSMYDDTVDAPIVSVKPSMLLIKYSRVDLSKRCELSILSSPQTCTVTYRKSRKRAPFSHTNPRRAGSFVSLTVMQLVMNMAIAASEVMPVSPMNVAKYGTLDDDDDMMLVVECIGCGEVVRQVQELLRPVLGASQVI